jgi:RHS repeat-associated protein
MGRVKTSGQQIGAGTTAYGFSYNYDLASALIGTGYPSGRSVYNTYDTAGRICAVDGSSAATCTASSAYASNVAYAPQGAVKSLQLGNGVQEVWTFNNLQQPLSLTATINSTALLSLGWGYNYGSDNGDVMSRTIARSSGLASPLTQTYTYNDPANRLATANEAGGWSQTYSYDAFGNRAVTAGVWLPCQNLTMPNAGYTPQHVSEFTAQNQWVRGTPNPSCGSTVNASFGDQYDCAGNQIALAMAASPYKTPASTFRYDGENRLLVANSAGVASFVYDGEGRRVQKITPSATTTYIRDAQGELAAEYSTAAPTASGTDYLTADTLGSTRLITDASGNPTRCIDYLPFGEEIPAGIDGRTGPRYESLGSTSTAQYPSAADTSGVDQKFTGKERDAETGLDYFGARYFSAAQGRFTSADEPFADQHPRDPQTWNLYSYVRNNPLALVDPTGTAITVAADATAQDRADYAQSTAYLSRDPGEKAIIDHLNGVQTNYTVEIIHDGNDRFDPNTNTVFWDPRSALATADNNGKLDGDTQTPALGLGHELDHANGKETGTTANGADPNYETKEEKRVINGSEKKAAQKLGEDTRTNHDGAAYESVSPTSRVPTRQGVQQLRAAEAARHQPRRWFHVKKHQQQNQNQ